MKDSPLNDSWTLAQELDFQLRLLRSGKTLDRQCDDTRARLVERDIAALKKDAAFWNRTADDLQASPLSFAPVHSAPPRMKPHLYIVR